MTALPRQACRTHLIIHGSSKLPLLCEAVVLCHVVAGSADMRIFFAKAFLGLKKGLLVILLGILMLFLQAQTTPD